MKRKLFISILVCILCGTTTMRADNGEQMSVYKKVTTAPADWSGRYLIVYDAGAVAMDGSQKADSMNWPANATAVKIVGDSIVLPQSDDNIYFTIDTCGTDVYYLKSASGLYIGNGTKSNRVSTSTATPYAHTLSLNADTSTLALTDNGTYSLRYNTDWKGFRYYKKTSTGSNLPYISLYRFAYTKAVFTLPVATIRDTICHNEDYSIDGEKISGLVLGENTIQRVGSDSIRIYQIYVRECRYVANNYTLEFRNTGKESGKVSVYKAEPMAVFTDETYGNAAAIVGVNNIHPTHYLAENPVVNYGAYISNKTSTMTIRLLAPAYIDSIVVCGATTSDGDCGFLYINKIGKDFGRKRVFKNVMYDLEGALVEKLALQGITYKTNTNGSLYLRSLTIYSRTLLDDDAQVTETNVRMCEGESYALQDRTMASSGDYVLYDGKDVTSLHLEVIPRERVVVRDTITDIETKSYGQNDRYTIQPFQSLTTYLFRDTTTSVRTGCDSVVAYQVLVKKGVYPQLLVSIDRDTLYEGESAIVTIRSDKPYNEDREIRLVKSYQWGNTNRVDLPQTVTMPAGSTETTAILKATDDKVANLFSEFYVQVEGDYFKTSSKDTVVLVDNDIPDFEIALDKDTVGEADCPDCITATITRKTLIDREETIYLYDTEHRGTGIIYDKNNFRYACVWYERNATYYPNNKDYVKFSSGQTTIKHNFGIKNNQQADGDRDVTITATIFRNQSPRWVGDTATTGNVGWSKATVHIKDDDVPTLTLTSNTTKLMEGKNPAATLTLKRNTTKDTAMTVALTADNPYGLTFRNPVTIAAGKDTARIAVAVAKDTIADNNRTVVFTAAAEGYKEARCYATVIDRTLPDAVLSEVGLNLSELLSGDDLTMTVKVRNDGAITLPRGLYLNIYDEKTDTVVASLTTTATLAADKEMSFTIPLTAQTRVGKQGFYAAINPDKQVKELFTDNNESKVVRVQVKAPYTATLTVDRSVCMPGDSVTLTGALTGRCIANTQVEVYTLNNGVRNAYTVETDAQGAFAMRYVPKAGQSGHIGFGACYPSEQLKTEMAAANYYAMSVGKRRVFCNLLAGIPYKGSIAVTNPGNLPLNDVKVEVLHTGFECTRTFTPIATLAGKTTGEIAFELMRTTASTENVWDTIPVRITTAEGLEARACLYCFTQDARGQMLLSTSYIATTIYTGETTDYTFYIYNSGLGETGEINVLLPQWMQALSATTLPSLAPQDTATISLRFVPDESMQLNVPLKGKIAINAKNANGVQLPYSIEPVSNKNGTLRIEVCDEYTYYSEGAPKVRNAQVVVKHPYTGAVVAQGLTNEQGIYEVVLPAGYYTLAVSADYHSSVNGTILLEADRTLEKQFNLSVQSIQVSFTVEETEVEDNYEIVTSVKYETNVPVPQVILDIPSMTEAGAMAEGESMIFYVTATNKGLITAEDVTLTWPTDNEDMLFEPLEYSEPFDLAAGQSVSIPLRLTRKAGAPAHSPQGQRRAAEEESRAIVCYEKVQLLYYWDCGPDRKYHLYEYPAAYIQCENAATKALEKFVEDMANNSSNNRSSISDIKIPMPNPVPVDTCYTDVFPVLIEPYEPTPTDPKEMNCQPCRTYKLMQLLDCAGFVNPQIVPGFAPYDAYAACSVYKDDIVNGEKEIDDLWRSAATCAEKAVACVPGPAGTIASKAIHCLTVFSRPCDHDTVKASSSRRKAQAYYRVTPSDDEPAFITRFRDVAAISADAIGAYNVLDTIYYGQELAEVLSYQEKADLLTVIRSYTSGKYTTAMFAPARPAAATDGMFSAFIARLNNTVALANGETVTGPHIDLDLMETAMRSLYNDNEDAKKMGYSGLQEMFGKELELFQQRMDSASTSVCASVQLSFSQKVAMTRQAFRGTLNVYNGHESVDMSDVHLTLNVYNKATGERITPREMEMQAERLTGFTGKASLDENEKWVLPANTTGEATFLFIPTKYAAPTDTTVYTFAGTLSYFDPYSQTHVDRVLYPVDVKVAPTAELELTYFMQRDVYGDDALTEEVEPSLPVEFALLLNNKGYGNAAKLRMTTSAPQIVDNQKGLKVDFRMLYSTLNGTHKSLSIDSIVPTDFGTLPARSQAYAQWYFESPLLGHFTEYSITSTHLTGYNNPDLSLLDTVTIHEMIHSIAVPSSGPAMVGWLVNDHDDVDDMPDTLYFSDATTASLCMASVATQRINDSTYTLVLTPERTGWSYGYTIDPTRGGQHIKSVTRLSDNASIDLRNVWQTPCVLRQGTDPIHEARLHIADDVTSATAYRIEFTERQWSAGDTLFVEPQTEMDAAQLPNTDQLNVVVRAQGVLDATAVSQLPVKSLFIETRGDYSGQVLAAANLLPAEVAMDMYLEPDADTAVAGKWYGFSLPFPVDMATGIRRACDTLPLVSGRDYSVMEYDGAQYATSGEGWVRKNSGVLQPGTFYMLCTSGTCNEWLFYKQADATLVSANELAVSHYMYAQVPDAGWNAIGNPLLQYSTPAVENVCYMYLYDNATATYALYPVEQTGLAVGRPFLVQVPEDETASFAEAGGAALPVLLRPNTDAVVPNGMMLSIAKEYSESAGWIYLTMSEAGDGQYTIGSDVKHIEGKGTALPLLWCETSGVQLTAHDIAAPRSETVIPLGIYAPTDGDYVLTLSPVDATSWTGYQVSLLRNRQTVQLLLPQSSAYLSLSAGITADYSLRISPTTPTSMEDNDVMQGNGVWYDILGRPAVQGVHGVYIRRGEKCLR